MVHRTALNVSTVGLLPVIDAILPCPSTTPCQPHKPDPPRKSVLACGELAKDNECRPVRGQTSSPPQASTAALDQGVDQAS